MLNIIVILICILLTGCGPQLELKHDTEQTLTLEEIHILGDSQFKVVRSVTFDPDDILTHFRRGDTLFVVLKDSTGVKLYGGMIWTTDK